MTASPLAVLLHRAIDYAGMFPPAELDVATAAARYAGYRGGAHAWALGSFVISSSRLDDLARAAEIAGPDPPGAWPLSIVLPREASADVERVASFASRSEGRFTVEAIEFPPVPPPDIEGLAARARFAPQIFFECPVDPALDARLDTVASNGAYAKIRTGGVIPEAFPESRQIVAFVRGCASRDLPWKATAGLHHALTGCYRLTYDSGSATADMHGFLNLGVMAAMFARLTGEESAALLRESDGGALQFEDGTITWRGHTVSQQEVGDMRRSSFRSFGSCSFEEPVDELHGMRLL